LVIGAIFLIAILFVVVYLNSSGVSFSPKTVRYNLTRDYNLSNSKVVGYGVYNQEDINSINKLIQESQNIFSQYKEENGKIYFIFGNENEVTLVSYEQIFGGSIGVVLGDKYSAFKIRQESYKSKKLSPLERTVDVEIEGQKYSFNLKKNENSYFIIYKNMTKEL